MNFLKKPAPFGVILAATILTACQTTATPARSGEVKMTKAEVVATFIGKPWRGDGTGRFHFKKNGGFTYKNSEFNVFGTYKISKNGRICAINSAKSKSAGRKTCFTFYRNGTKYRYFHDRSGKYWPAYVK